MTQKPDAIRIQAHIDQLKEAAWLGTARAWWPDYVFHFTDINNVPKILRAGYLLSRERALQINPDFIDSGSRSVLQKTAEQWKQYVRFYFRPKTPTLYRNEGIRPLKAQTLEAHCPVPIYLLFDSKAVLSLAETKFSNGNLARQNTFTYFGAADFERLPFQSIYHDGSISNNIDKDNIINCRHAEIIVPLATRH